MVLSTLLHASDEDFRLIILRDCCAEQDAELHSCLLDKFFPRRATVLSASDFLENLSPAAAPS